jgi:hypothetical protein
MRMFRVSIRYDHLGERQTPEGIPDAALIVEGNVREDYAFAVVEADMELPICPTDIPAIHLEGHTLGLSYLPVV